MCSAPVTLGGGMTMTNFGFVEPFSGVKKPHFSHQLYQAASTRRGEYALGSSPLTSLRSPAGVARAAARAAASPSAASSAFGFGFSFS